MTAVSTIIGIPKSPKSGPPQVCIQIQPSQHHDGCHQHTQANHNQIGDDDILDWIHAHPPSQELFPRTLSNDVFGTCHLIYIIG